MIICSCSAESKNVALGPHSFRSTPSSLQNGERNSKGFSEKILQKQEHKNEQKSFQKPEIRGDEDFSQNSQKRENPHKRDDTTLSSPQWRGARGEVPKIFVYCHTPIRYYWSHFEEYKNMMEFGIFNPIAKLIFPMVVNWMRKLDYEASQAVDVFWGNSETTVKRIQKFYHRDAEVIYPGIDVEQFSPSTEK